MKGILSIIIILTFGYYSFGQVSAGPDKSVCDGQPTQLEGAGPSGWEYTWTSVPMDPSISNPNVLTPTVQPSVTTTYTLTGSNVTDVNLVDNGDFEQGNTGFTSNYDYCDQNDCLNVSPPDGIYGINSNPSFLHNSFPSCGDHTTGSGNMMVVNGDEFSNNTLYETTVTNISPNTNYEFSAWITSMVWSIPMFGANFKFEINGTNIGTYSATSSLCTWGQFFYTWNSGSSTSAVIRIVNTTAIASGMGNDFAIDDIALYEIEEDSDVCIVTVEDIPTSDFSTADITCLSDIVNVEYTGNASSSATYNWDFGADAIIISGSGQGPYDIQWTTPGIKTISLWVDNGCISNTSYNNTQVVESPDIDILADQTTILYGTNTILHGIISSPQNTQFTWSPQTMLEDATILDPQTIPLEQTTKYFLNVIDDISNCSSIDSITIVVDGGPLTILSFTASEDTICENQNTELTVNVSGGTEDYTISWTSSPLGFLHIGPETQLTVSPVVTTEYFVTVDDGYNAISSSNKITVMPLTEITIQPLDITQISGSSATFSVTANNANNYQWQVSLDGGSTWSNTIDGSEYSGSNTPILSISPVDNSMDGNIYHCITDGHCNELTSNSALLSVTDSPDFISTLGNDEACEGDTISIDCIVQNFLQIIDFSLVIDYDNSIVNYISLININNDLINNITIQESGGSIIVDWNSSQGISIPNGEIFEILFVGTTDGASSISWNQQTSSITNEPGMQPDMILSDGEALVNELSFPVTSITSSYDTINYTDEIPIELNAIGGSGDELIWSANSCYGDTIHTGNPLEIIRPDITTTYYAYWINQCGISACAEKEVVIIYDYNVGIPNAFTANNDGLNDDFRVVTSAPLSDFKMQIFNRNGALIFETFDQNDGWNGDYKGKLLPMGVYIWKVSYGSPGTGIISEKGTVTMIR